MSFSSISGDFLSKLLSYLSTCPPKFLIVTFYSSFKWNFLILRERISSLDECRNKVVIISVMHHKIRRRSTKSIAINSPRDIGLSTAGLCRARKARRHGRKRANLDSVQTPGSNASRTSVRPIVGAGASRRKIVGREKSWKLWAFN